MRFVERLKRWNAQRKSDRKLRKAAWKRLRKADTRDERRNARKIWAAFAFRAAVFWHGPGNDFAKKVTGGFKYGEYCGVGHGSVEGKRVPPINPTDAACQVHDVETSSIWDADVPAGEYVTYTPHE